MLLSREKEFHCSSSSQGAKAGGQVRSIPLDNEVRSREGSRVSSILDDRSNVKKQHRPKVTTTPITTTVISCFALIYSHTVSPYECLLYIGGRLTNFTPFNNNNKGISL
jgi:hypothetical protein